MNTTEPVTFFIIEGFKDNHLILFVIFLTMYVIILGGNAVIIYLITTDSKLHSPMYFFLHNLSFYDMMYTSVTIPNMLSGFLVKVKTISKAGCIMQMYIFLSMCSIGCALLTVMAFDRYLAICHPLHYSSIMTRRVRYLLIFLAWLYGWLSCVPALSLAVPLPFCGPNLVKHVFCDHSSVIRLACTDITTNSRVGLAVALFVLISTFLLILSSYIFIGRAISKMTSADRLKAGATCVSHLIVVCIYYVGSCCVYISYRVTIFDQDIRLVIAVLYAAFTPMLNPFIYSLRNKELQDALKRAVYRFRTASYTVRKTVPSIS